MLNQPTLPNYIQLRDYQLEALENWKANNYIGFFEMATGTGKTITALNCALELYETDGYLQLIILVPTITLATQWAEEAENFNFDNIIIANSANKKWLKQVTSVINLSFFSNPNVTIITTYATFITPNFQSVVNAFSRDVCLIADEAHNFGTARHIAKYPRKFKRRIGLSATPKRHFDEEETEKLLDFFGAANGVTFEFGMQKAIDNGFLCKYFYYPYPVYLTDDEMEDYIIISKKLLKFFNPATKRFKENPVVTRLLLRRKSIIHKAAYKLNCFRTILRKLTQEQEELKYTLVYVPEGISQTENTESAKIIDEYATVISKEFNLNQHQFTGETKHRDTILKQFSKGTLNILTAMKCLDEGIAVKRTEIAIFGASTSNPRQFIQRRGRVLRTHPDNATKKMGCGFIVLSRIIASF